jgi:predicted amidohydrolase YtcJ
MGFYRRHRRELEPDPALTQLVPDVMKATIWSASSIVTMTGERPQAFATLGERIVATGSVAQLRERYPEAEVVDFGDVTIAPGFNDAHAHLSSSADAKLHVDASPGEVSSLAEIIARLRERVAITPPGEWVVALRYDDAKMREGRVLTRADLDDVSTDHPIFVRQISAHWAVANTPALARGNYTDAAAEAPPGGELGRDGNGRLNGLLFETAIHRYMRPTAGWPQPVIPALPMDARLTGLKRAAEDFHAAGITSITDALVTPNDLTMLQEAQTRGTLSLRVNVLLSYQFYNRVRDHGIPGFGGNRLRLNGIKTAIDGAVGGRTCLMDEPFEGTSDDFGIQTMSDADLADVVRMVHLDGNRVCVHANGDKAIKKVLGAMEAAHRERPSPELHHRIEHCTIVNDEILSRLKKLHAIAVPFGSYVNFHGGKLLDWFGPKRIERMFAHRSFIDHGVAVAGSSDFPAGPFEVLLALQSCVTRDGYDGAPLGHSQRISQEEALAMYTTRAAYATGEDHLKGKLAPGYLADFVVLENDPLTVRPEQLSTIGVAATYVGAEQVWARTG